MNKLNLILLTLLLPLFLIACETSEQQAARVCPRVGILSDASRVTVFGNESEDRTVENVAYDIELSNADLVCKYNDDVIKADVTFTADMWAGVKAPIGTKSFRYFVAVTELNTSVVTKEYFDIEADFTKRSRVTANDQVKDIRINYQKLGRGDLYEILIGWDLTPGQLKYNRETSAFDRPDIRQFQGDIYAQ